MKNTQFNVTGSSGECWLRGNYKLVSTDNPDSDNANVGTELRKRRDACASLFIRKRFLRWQKRFFYGIGKCATPTWQQQDFI